MDRKHRDSSKINNHNKVLCDTGSVEKQAVLVEALALLTFRH